MQLALRKLAGLLVRAGEVLAPVLEPSFFQRLIQTSQHTSSLQRLKESIMQTMQLASFSMTITLVVERADGAKTGTTPAGIDAQLHAALRKAAGVPEGAGVATVKAVIAQWGKEHPQQLRELLTQYGGEAGGLLSQALASREELDAMHGVITVLQHQQATMQGEVQETKSRLAATQQEVQEMKVTLHAFLAAVATSPDGKAIFSRIQETGQLLVLKEYLPAEDQQQLLEVGRPLTVQDIKEMNSRAAHLKLPALATWLAKWWKDFVSLATRAPTAKFLTGIVKWFEKQG
jgi:hypothetical protein